MVEAIASSRVLSVIFWQLLATKLISEQNCNVVFALFVVGPIFSILGPRLSWFLGGWT